MKFLMERWKRFVNENEVYDQKSYDLGLSNEDGTRTQSGKLLGNIAKRGREGYTPSAGQKTILSILSDEGLISYGLHPMGGSRAVITDKGLDALSCI